MSGAPLVVTMGEPAGVGGEISMAAWRERNRLALPPFFMLDDPARLEALAAQLDWPVPVTIIRSPEQAAAVFPDALPVLPLSWPVTGKSGKPASGDADLVLEAIERSVSLCQSGEASGLVTNPISKAHLYQAGFRHPGHTEFIAELCGGQQPVMMLAGPELRTVPATIHCPLIEVAERLSEALLIQLGRIVHKALKTDFGLPEPRLAMTGLNPHAGESGAMGREEIDFIRPAMAALRAEGITITGPHPADSLFHADARAGFDAAICMYHDQALIPVKTLDFDRTVNVTLGLPVVRTSPDHGTAFDIAGKGIARADSLIASIRLAGEMARNRAG